MKGIVNTSFQNFIGYWYQDGYIRTSSSEFTLKNLESKMIHLTNDAVQKKGDSYGKYENGNKVNIKKYILKDLFFRLLEIS